VLSVLRASQTELGKYVFIGAKNVSNKAYVGNSTHIVYPVDSSVSRPDFDIIKIPRANAPEFYRTRIKFQHIAFVAVHLTEENNLNESTACEGMQVGLYRQHS
jgi:hypothetical protein